jgi:hypothetical protein
MIRYSKFTFLPLIINLTSRIKSYVPFPSLPFPVANFIFSLSSSHLASSVAMAGTVSPHDSKTRIRRGNHAEKKMVMAVGNISLSLLSLARFNDKFYLHVTSFEAFSASFCAVAFFLSTSRKTIEKPFRCISNSFENCSIIS